MFCSKCGSQLNEGSAFCAKCGASVAPVVEQVAADVSPKSRLATSLLAWFLGMFGAHRFYTGKIGTAVIMLILGVVSGVCWFGGFFGGLAAEREEPIWGLLLIAGVLYFAVWVWMIIDFIIAVTGNFKDSQGKIIKKW
jgi:TM2 domain-containing membrane protein YozV